MPYVQFGRNRVNYGLRGEEGRDVIVFVNGLTQTTALWVNYQEWLAQQGYRVLAYDSLGQGMSSKPVLGIHLEDHADVLVKLLDELAIKDCFIAGISFGGVVAQHVAINHPERVRGLIPMSTFSEMPTQLEMFGLAFHSAITQAGFPLIQSLLMPMNFSSGWLSMARNSLSESMRRGYAVNDPYAIQNLMESYVNFRPFTEDLNKIKCPTLILNGEYDFLTPRICHEILRLNIPNSRLMIIQHAYHAFTLEHPEITMRVIEAFVRSVREGTWIGDKSVWVASDNPQSEVVATRYVGDHLRSVFIPRQHEDIDEWRMSVAGVLPAAVVQPKAKANSKKAAPVKKAAKPTAAKPVSPKPASAKPAAVKKAVTGKTGAQLVTKPTKPVKTSQPVTIKTPAKHTTTSRKKENPNGN